MAAEQNGGWVRGRRARKAAALVAAALPTNGLRKWAYRLLHGYVFGPGVKLAHGVFIAVDRFECGANVSISRGNRFYGPIRVVMGAKTFIGPRNQIMCGDAVVDAWADDRNYGRALLICADCLINEGHMFDVVGTITVEDGAWLAGFRSQFVTHGASVRDRDIHIGARSFLGTAVLMAPGSSLGPDTLLAMGSLVTKKFTEANVIVGGTPARVLRTRDPADEHQFEKVWQ